MIEKRIKYYCTDCEIEYDDKESIGVCTNHPDIELCEECGYICDKYNEGKDSMGDGCHKWVCEDCIHGSPFDAIYEPMYCTGCLERLNIDPWLYSYENRNATDEEIITHEGPSKLYTRWLKSQE